MTILTSVKLLIEELIVLHESFSRDFLRQYQKPLNLKKLLVSDLFDDQGIIRPFFLDYIQDYHNKLGRLIATIELEYQYNYLNCRVRVKQKDSIINKLVFYREGKSEQGKMPIRKCLNDLLGIRIILDDFKHNELCGLCNSQDNVRCIDSSKNGYKASHFYFQGKSNEYFPWELQVWRNSDAIHNEISHKVHKRKRQYIEWPQLYIASAKDESDRKGGE